MIEQNGFTTIDDLMHGYGGGYFPPIVGSTSRPVGRIPDMPLKAGMMVVVQPNVATKDGKAGVQTGEALLITKTGWNDCTLCREGLRGWGEVCAAVMPREGGASSLGACRNKSLDRPPSRAMTEEAKAGESLAEALLIAHRHDQVVVSGGSFVPPDFFIC
jgi:hypothetical protein